MVKLCPGLRLRPIPTFYPLCALPLPLHSSVRSPAPSLQNASGGAPIGARLCLNSSTTEGLGGHTNTYLACKTGVVSLDAKTLYM